MHRAWPWAYFRNGVLHIGPVAVRLRRKGPKPHPKHRMPHEDGPTRKGWR